MNKADNQSLQGQTDKKLMLLSYEQEEKIKRKISTRYNSLPAYVPDGICRVTDKLYTKTLCFQDINYQLAQNEDKTAIFDSWCDFLNYFDSSIHFPVFISKYDCQ